VKRSEVTHHLFILILLISVNGLRVLTQVVKTRKLLPAMARERTLSSVFSDVPGQMLAPAEDHTTFAVASALKGFCRGRSVAFVNATAAGEERTRIIMGY
jgi:hypothetical protein